MLLRKTLLNGFLAIIFIPQNYAAEKQYPRPFYTFQSLAKGAGEEKRRDSLEDLPPPTGAEAEEQHVAPQDFKRRAEAASLHDIRGQDSLKRPRIADKISPMQPINAIILDDLPENPKAAVPATLNISNDNNYFYKGTSPSTVAFPRRTSPSVTRPPVMQLPVVHHSGTRHPVTQLPVVYHPGSRLPPVAHCPGPQSPNCVLPHFFPLSSSLPSSSSVSLHEKKKKSKSPPSSKPSSPKTHDFRDFSEPPQ